MKDDRIKKIIYKIGYCKHLDSSCNDNTYKIILDQMNDSESIYYDFLRNSNTKKVEEDVLKIFEELNDEEQKLEEALQENLTNTNLTKKQIERTMKRRCLDFYGILGKVLDKTNIIDSLIKRNNKLMINNDLKILTVDRKQALSEFDEYRQKSCEMQIMFPKIIFWVNKIVKYVNSLEYYTQYLEDSTNSTRLNQDRNKYVSHLKTQFLEAIINEANENKRPIEEYIQKYSLKYEELFKDDYCSLNMGKDIFKLETYNNLKKGLYNIKSNLTGFSLSLLLGIDECKKNTGAISKWGICKDNDTDKYVLGIELKGYPMPLTVHVQQDTIDIVANLKSFITIKNHSFPLYRTRMLPCKGKFTTNLLYKTTLEQRNKLAELCKKDDTNKPLKEMLEQIDGTAISITNGRIVIPSADQSMR